MTWVMGSSLSHCVHAKSCHVTDVTRIVYAVTAKGISVD